MPLGWIPITARGPYLSTQPSTGKRAYIIHSKSPVNFQIFIKIRLFYFKICHSYHQHPDDPIKKKINADDYRDLSDDDVLEDNGPGVITLAQKNGNETAEIGGSKILKNCD